MTIEWSKFKTEILVGEELRNVIVNIVGDIISENPTKEESYQLRYYPGRSCYEIKNLSKEDMKEYLLEFIRYFYYRKGRIPLMVDFNNNPKYPSLVLHIKKKHPKMKETISKFKELAEKGEHEIQRLEKGSPILMN